MYYIWTDMMSTDSLRTSSGIQLSMKKFHAPAKSCNSPVSYRIIVFYTWLALVIFKMKKVYNKKRTFLNSSTIKYHLHDSELCSCSYNWGGLKVKSLSKNKKTTICFGSVIIYNEPLDPRYENLKYFYLCTSCEAISQKSDRYIDF